MYEYKIESVYMRGKFKNKDHAQDWLNELGKEGWELVTVTMTDPTDSNSNHLFFLKREVVQEASTKDYIDKDGSLVLTTYHDDPDMNADGIRTVFKVPFEWAEDEIMSWFNWTVDEFMVEYTYDMSEIIYQEAKKQGKLITYRVFKEKEGEF